MKKHISTAILSIFLSLSLINSSDAQNRQQQQQQQQQQQNQLLQLLQLNSGWRTLGKVDNFQGSRFKPLQCEYRLVQAISSTPQAALYDFHAFNSASILKTPTSTQLSSQIPLETSASLFNADKDQTGTYDQLLNMRHEKFNISCKLVYTPDSLESKLFIHCGGHAESPDPTLSGPEFQSLVLLDTAKFTLQEKC